MKNAKKVPNDDNRQSRSRMSKKDLSPSRHRERSLPRESKQDFEILPETEVAKANLWLHRINENFTSSS